MRDFRRAILSLFVAIAVLAPLPGAAANGVEPFRDGIDGFAKMATLIRSAKLFVHYVAWGFDDEMSWNTRGPRPGIVSRTNTNPMKPPPPVPKPGTPVENLRCGAKGAPDPDSLTVLLRCSASNLALLAEKAKPTPAGVPNTVRGESMVLVWNQELDFNNLAPPLNNLGDIVYTLVPYNALIKWTAPILYTQMRVRGSGESQEILTAFQAMYQKPAFKTLFAGKSVVMPTGIQVMVQKNQNGGTVLGMASHHQKLIITEQAAFVGGLNSLKEYWDDHNHLQNNPARWSSELVQPPSSSFFGAVVANLGFARQANWSDVPAPLHDTGAIVTGDIVTNVNNLFSDRWLTNFNPAFAANATTVPAMPAAVRAGIVKMQTLLTTGYKTLPGAVQAAIKPQLNNALALLAYFNSPTLPSTPFYYLKRQLFIQWVSAATLLHPVDSATAGAATWQMVQTLDALEAKIQKTISAPASAANPAVPATNVVFVTSHPSSAYQAVGAPPHDIRDQYYKELAKLKVGSFAYFENQFVGDHDFAIKLFKACAPKDPNDAGWCRADGFAHIVIPYVPGGSGISTLDLHKVVPDTVKEEMQNLVWLEIKSAISVWDRATNSEHYIFVPKGSPCNPGNPDIKFLGPANNDPSLVTINSQVQITGSDKTKPCPTGAGFFIQTTVVVKVSDIMCDGAIMSYVLASNPPLPPVPTWTYNSFLLANAIYVHSKHSEFWEDPTHDASTYVVGSANLNTRSLGNVLATQKDSNDSEDAIFWTPGAKDAYWLDIWKEHLMIQPPAVPPPVAANLIGTWEQQGRANYALLFPGGKGNPNLTGRVVRLDAVERCIDLKGTC